MTSFDSFFFVSAHAALCGFLFAAIMYFFVHPFMRVEDAWKEIRTVVLHALWCFPTATLITLLFFQFEWKSNPLWGNQDNPGEYLWVLFWLMGIGLFVGCYFAVVNAWKVPLLEREVSLLRQEKERNECELRHALQYLSPDEQDAVSAAADRDEESAGHREAVQSSDALHPVVPSPS